MSFQQAVAAAYRDILQREPTEQELAEALGGGESDAALAALISTLSQGSEAQTFVWPVMRIYQGVYGRVPDEGGLGYWVDRYRAEDVQALDNPATATVNEALVALARVFTDPEQTPEFVQRFGADPSTATYVEALYVNVLNRAPDEGGRLYWIARFESLMAELEAQGLSASSAKAEARAIFLEQFVLSQEYTVAASELAVRFLAASAYGVETFEGDLWARDENYAPIPRDDAVTVDEDDFVQVDVLANDLDLDDGDTPSTFSLGSVVVASVTGAQVTVEELNAAAAATVVGGKLQFDATGLFNDLPAGGQATVTIAYEVIDDGGASSTGEAVITVVGANDAPTQISLSANDVPENAPGALVGLLNAADPDTGASIVYSLVEQSGAQSHLFTIVGNELRVGSAGIDFEALLNPLFVVVRASDGQEQLREAFGIDVINVDEGGPVFTSGTTASIQENQPTGTIYTAVASDPAGPISYALAGPDALLFNINSATGALSFKASPDFEAPLDSNQDNIYEVIIIASDAVGEQSQRSVSIHVTNLEDQGPSFTSGTTASVAENVATTTAVYTAAASDPNGPVSYALSGTDAALFALNATTGALTFLASPDHEAPGDAGGNNVYDVVITAADALGNETQRAVAITVTDVDEVGPSFTSGTTASVAENVATTTAVYTAAASDPNGPVSYALSGTDAALFALNATTGALTFLASPDHEAPGDAGGNNVYDVVITAADALGNETQRAVAITVTDAHIWLLSVSNAGVQGDSYSEQPSISADGRYVAFLSLASNLVGSDTNGAEDIFLRDLLLGTTARVSVDSAEVQGNNTSTSPSMSADGRYVTFLSYASNLVGSDNNGVGDIFVRDLTLGTTTRVSVDNAGMQGNSDSVLPSVSADGRYVTFHSFASNLVGSDTNGTWDIFVRDSVDGTTSRVSVSSAEVQGDSDSSQASISADGRYVAFNSYASNLVGSDTNGYWDIFVRDLVDGTTTLVSVDSGGLPGNGGSYDPSISADGRYVSFTSAASNLVAGDTNGAFDIFVRDLTLGITMRVSVNNAGVQGNSASDSSSVSADGRYVTFQSFASNLVAGDTNGAYDIFVRDLILGVTTRVSLDRAGVQGNGDSLSPSISADGRYVTFTSSASNLVTGDTNGTTRDIFVVDGVEQGWWFP